MKGQNARRPKIASSAGRRVHITTIARPMPIAPMSARPEVPFTSARPRHSRPSITVAADATMAGPAVRIAVATASCLSRWRRASSL
jgi:hypothetical protein